MTILAFLSVSKDFFSSYFRQNIPASNKMWKLVGSCPEYAIILFTQALSRIDFILFSFQPSSRSVSTLSIIPWNEGIFHLWNGMEFSSLEFLICLSKSSREDTFLSACQFHFRVHFPRFKHEFLQSKLSKLNEVKSTRGRVRSIFYLYGLKIFAYPVKLPSVEKLKMLFFLPSWLRNISNWKKTCRKKPTVRKQENDKRGENKPNSSDSADAPLDRQWTIFSLFTRVTLNRYYRCVGIIFFLSQRKIAIFHVCPHRKSNRSRRE